jgi:hypothetical protein
MALYSPSVYTEIYNAVYDASKSRSEFRLPADTLFLSNMRILNLGITAIDANTGRYNLINGATGAIVKNIYLYDGSVVIDKIINFSDFSAFQEYNHSNQANSDIYKILHRSGLGFVYDRTPNAAAAVAQPILIKEQFPNAPHKPQLLAENSPQGFLNLRECMPILKGAGGMPYVHTGLFKNFRLVIEYNVVDSLVGAGVELPLSTLQPILVADCIKDAKVASDFLSSFKQQVWVSNEVESVQVPTPDAPTLTSKLQAIKFRLTGAEDKTVNYILMQKKSLGTNSGDVSALYKNHASETMIGETTQLFVNGSAHLPEQGVIAPNQRLALVHDTWSVCNAIPSSNSLPMYGAATVVADAADRCGRLDYFSCVVNKKISSLDLTYSRELPTDVPNRYKQPLNLNIFYGVLKSIVKDNKGGYQVVYV